MFCTLHLKNYILYKFFRYFKTLIYTMKPMRITKKVLMFFRICSLLVSGTENF